MSKAQQFTIAGALLAVLAMRAATRGALGGEVSSQWLKVTGT